MSAQDGHREEINLPEVSACSKASKQYFSTQRAFVTGLGLTLSILLPCMEITIVSTSLITISNDLDSYTQSSWVVTSYLLTYTSFLIIWANLGDIFGIKASLITSIILFMAFSGGCGAAQTMNQLIINRAFQGIGGAGAYSLALIAYVQMVPPSQYNLISFVASVSIALGLILGPLVGGAINNSGLWRWAFLLNVPAGAVGIFILTFALPQNFPHHCEPSGRAFQLGLLRKIDFFGTFLLLSATVLLVTALSEGEIRYAWDSAFIISFFTISGILWIAFVIWQWFASRSKWTIQPLFPWRFFRNRVWMGILIGSFLTGATSTVAFIEIPQRFQIVNGNDPFHAGVKLLAYAAGIPIGTAVPTSMSKIRVPFIVCLVIGTVTQIISFSLLSTIPTTFKVWEGEYGYYFLAGFGVGASLGTQYMMAPFVVDLQDKNVALGTVVQLRMLGGALGIAISNSVLNSYVWSHLRAFLPDAQIDVIIKSPRGIAAAPPSERDQVRKVFGEAYNLQMRAAIVFSSVQVLSILLVWKKKQLRLNKEASMKADETVQMEV